MDAASLNQHLQDAKSAAESYEAGIVVLVGRLINNQANVAAYKFRNVVEPVGDGWIEPHPDEVFDVEQMEAKMQKQLGGRREQALRAFTRELPDTVTAPSLAAAGRRRRPVEGQIKLNWDVTSPFIAPVLERTGEHVATVTQTTRNKVVSVIADSYQHGLSIDDTAKAIRDTVRSSSLGRANTIAKTEMVRLTSGAQVAATKAVSDAAGIGYYKRWLTAPGAEHPRHEDYDGLDGQTVTLDGLFDVGGEQLDYPGDPDGSPEETCNCRCLAPWTPVSGRLTAAMMRAFEGDLFRITTAAGRETTVTGNHPILTRRGWVEARRLVKGDDLVCRSVAEFTRHPDVEHMESEAHERFATIQLSAARSERVTSSRVNLHGEIPEDEIDVVWADDALTLEGVASIDQHLKQLALTLSHREMGFYGRLASRFRIEEPDPISLADSSQRDSSVPKESSHGSSAKTVALAEGENAFPVQVPSDQLLRDRIKPSHKRQMHRLGFASSDSLLPEIVPDGGLVAIEQVTDLLEGHPGLVELDPLVDLCRFYYSGHVYNFSSPTGTLTTDSIISANCSLEMVESEAAVSEDLAAAGSPSAGLPSHETTMEEPVDTEQLADQPMEGQCANCDHAASDHAGEMNDGECTVDECSCQGMEVAKAPSDDDGDENAAKAEPLTATASAVVPNDQAFVLTLQNGWTNVATTSGTAGTSTYRLVPVTAATEVALPPELQATEELPEENASPEAPTVDLGTSAAYARWNAIFAPEGKATDDGRIFAPGSIGWRDLPLSLMAMTETPGEGGHAGAELCGRIDGVYRDDAVKPVLIRADGVFNDDEVGSRIAQLVDGGFLTGNSVDLAVSGSKVALRSDVVDDEGFWIEGLNPADIAEVDMLAVMFGEIPIDEVLFVITEAVIGMSTVCPFPAFAEASISLAADGSQRKWTMFQGIYPALQTVHMGDAIRLIHADALLTASAAGLVPVVPPAEWFTNPKLDEYTGLTVTDDGRVYGHAWEWDTCHIGIQDSCTVAPHSETGYAYFLLKEVETDDGQRVECGTITLDTNHAGRHLAWRDAASHYDHTGTAIADVTFGEDEYGGWFSGALRPDASAEAVRKFRGATVSGDWRRIHGNLELVGLLSVNVPGFPVPRTRALVASADDGSEVLTLIAAGIPEGPKPADVTEAGLAELALLAEQARGGLDELASLAAKARS